MADQQVKTAAVDRDRLRAIIGDAVKQVESEDPARLRAEIARLTAELAKPSRGATAESAAATAEADRRGYERGFWDAASQAKVAYETLKEQVRGTVRVLADSLEKNIASEKLELTQSGSPVAPPSASPSPRPTAVPTGRAPTRAASGDGSLPGPQQRIVDAIMWWNVMGVPAPSHAQVGFIAGFSHKSGTWATYLSRLRSSGMIEGRGDLVLTGAGIAAANRPGAPPSGVELRTTVLGRIDAPLAKILTPIMKAYPRGLSHAEAGEKSGYSAASGTWATYLSRLRSLDLIEGRGDLKAQGWLFP
ncbi:hypothetical protein J4G48_0015135 [Bradyrhizobium barranii subsp. apii]|uniref:hypothetical protein n=1 Tax=Bradyrhizobium barranii TaxID=2992140 RepID=UPI001AA19BE9|nr:hypothetical protein [Bradyrhizobium barranii]UPT99298.1 hypothetical protein J4G48_0015135 [Bradyrhizobium barranii subsp. apii]